MLDFALLSDTFANDNQEILLQQEIQRASKRSSTQKTTPRKQVVFMDVTNAENNI